MGKNFSRRIILN